MFAVGGANTSGKVDIDVKPTPIFLLPVDRRAIVELCDRVQYSAHQALTTGPGTHPASPLSPPGSGGDDGHQSDDSDDCVNAYRTRRQRNNEAARRSRAKRRRMDVVLRCRLEELATENRQLRAQLSLLNDQLSRVISGDRLVPIATSTSSPSSIHSDRKSRDDEAHDSSPSDVISLAKRRRRARGEHSSSRKRRAASRVGADDVITLTASQQQQSDCADETMTSPLNLSVNRLITDRP